MTLLTFQLSISLYKTITMRGIASGQQKKPH